MSSPVSRPVYPGTTSHGAAYKQVKVISVNNRTYRATVVDQFGKSIDVRYDIIRAKGNPPQPGEMWLIDRMYGFWTFGAIMNGGLGGVVIPPDNVTGLNSTLDDHQTQITNQVNSTTGQVASKGDLLSGTGPGQVTRQPAGVDGAVPVYLASTATGLTSRVPLALTAPLTGAVAPARFVGGTSSGPPTSGTFNAGDHITTTDGNTWLCTVGGSPGTWTQSAPGALTVDGSKLKQNNGNPLLASPGAGSGIQLASGVVQSVDGYGSTFAQHRADSFMVMSANNAVIGAATGNAAFLSGADGAGVKLASGQVLITDGPGTGFGVMKSQSVVLNGANNATIGGVGGNAAFLSGADGGGIKFGSSIVQIVNGSGGLFQKLKAYDFTVASANNAYIGLNGPNCAFLSPADGSGFKFGSNLMQITDGTGNAFGPAKCTVMTQTSSGRLKEQIRPLRPHKHGRNTFTDIVMSVKAQRFKFTHEVKNKSGPNGKTNEDHIGFVAEELYQAHPDLVLGELGDPNSLAIAPMSLIAVLWEMNKELVHRIEVLEGNPVDSSGSGTK